MIRRMTSGVTFYVRRIAAASVKKPVSRLWLLGLIALSSAGCQACKTCSAGTEEASGVSISQYGATLRVEIDGKPFTDYHYQNVSRPFLYPVIGPTGSNVARNWPMGDAHGEEHDHPHHKSLWYAHGDLNGVDFWSESDKAGTTEHVAFTKIESGREFGTIESKQKLVSKEGKTIATDDRTIRIYARDGEARMLDYEITIHASHGDLTLGDTKEGSMAIRLTPSMRLKGKIGEGHIVNSAGDRDDDTWGKRAAWCDYYGPVDGKTAGVAIFDHPSNPRHPTWWHVRNYGLFAANPFGVHYFEKKPAGAGDLNVPSGESVTFRYRFLFHHGDEVDGHVAENYERYSGE
jgi:hypothetical protein